MILKLVSKMTNKASEQVGFHLTVDTVSDGQRCHAKDAFLILVSFESLCMCLCVHDIHVSYVCERASAMESVWWSEDNPRYHFLPSNLFETGS